jgi:hypothetical protein
MGDEALRSVGVRRSPRRPAHHPQIDLHALARGTDKRFAPIGNLSIGTGSLGELGGIGSRSEAFLGRCDMPPKDQWLLGRPADIMR